MKSKSTLASALGTIILALAAPSVASAKLGNLDVSTGSYRTETGEDKEFALLTFEGYVANAMITLIRDKAPTQWHTTKHRADDVACDSFEFPPHNRPIRCYMRVEKGPDETADYPILQWLFADRDLGGNADAYSEDAGDRLKVTMKGRGARKLYKLMREWGDAEASMTCTRRRHHWVLFDYTCTMFLDDQGRATAD